MRRSASGNLVARASVAVADIRRVAVVEGVARHKPKDVEQAGWGVAASGQFTEDELQAKEQGQTYGTWVKLNDREIRKPASRMRFST